MTIAVVIQSLVMARGGAERFTHNLLRGLVQRAHDVSVLCHEWDDGAAALPIERIRVPRARGWRHPWRAFSDAVWQALGRARRHDVVLGLTQLCPQDVHRFGGGVYRYWFERKYGRCLPLHLLRPHVRQALAFERAMYTPGNYRHLIAISEMDRQLLLRYYDVPPERVHTVYNGFDMEEFHARDRADARAELCAMHAIPPERTVVLFAANNYERKGLPQAIEALLHTRDPRRFALVVIGKAHAHVARALRQRCARRLQHIWLDRVPNPAAFYRGADFLVFPTLYDSFANVIGEALCCGLPVITTRQAGGAEMIKPGVNGYVVAHAGAHEELRDACEALGDRERCASFSAHARDVVGALTIERCTHETVRVLELARQERA
jgi:UDP-glucose:(heptosyl)LPS alpha-1,3-glucosyltransferase